MLRGLKNNQYTEVVFMRKSVLFAAALYFAAIDKPAISDILPELAETIGKIVFKNYIIPVCIKA